jgi:hypothetical protein
MKDIVKNINGAQYHLANRISYKSKSKARKTATNMRDLGFNARVIKNRDGGYDLYGAKKK